MTSLAAGLDYVDLLFLGHPHVIATGILHGAEGVALVDPGPSTTWNTLEAALRHHGFSPQDVRAILLTHIHLDHAGATGTIVARCPNARVVVHARGARHMADPSRLLASAGRLYGDDMQRLWGDVLPVPADRIQSLEIGGDRHPETATLTIVGHEIHVAWTPGHASHHVTYFLPGPRLAFVGDTAGICRPGSRIVLPATPPPDVDLDAWRRSTAQILRWDPATVFLTHFGPHPAPRVHFQAFWRRLDDWTRRTQALLAADLGDDERERRFAAAVADDLRREVGPAETEAYAAAGRFDYSWRGLARHEARREKGRG